MHSDLLIDIPITAERVWTILTAKGAATRV